MRLVNPKNFFFVVVLVSTVYLLNSTLVTIRPVITEDLENNKYHAIEVKEIKSFSAPILGESVNRGKDYYFIVIFIPSLPKSFRQRQNLRTKYLNMSQWNANEFKNIKKQYLTFKLMFSVGKMKNGEYSEELLKEESENEDMYMMDIEESLEILPEKLSRGMKKSVELFNYSYFVKVDHDTLVDLPHLFRGLAAKPRNNLYTGSCNKKLMTTPYRYTFKYCLGGGYVISRDLVEKMSLLEENVAQVPIPFEDGYVGYLMSKVKKRYKIAETLPRTNARILQPYMVGNSFEFTKYFYHYLKDVRRFDKIFDCRITANRTECPLMKYHYPAGEKSCVCTLPATQMFKWLNLVLNKPI